VKAIDRQVDEFWASVFAVAVEDLWAEGVRVVVDAPGLDGYPGAYLLRLGDTCIVAVPVSAFARAKEAIVGKATDEVFTRGFAADLYPGSAGRFLGPSWHGYLAHSALRLGGSVRARPLRRGDEVALGRFRERVGEKQWAEAGFEPRPAVVWVLDDDAGIASAGNLSEFAGSPADVGIVTRPDARGQGLATDVVAAMCRATPTAMFRYRALESNAASKSVAARLGFGGRGANIAVRFE